MKFSYLVWISEPIINWPITCIARPRGRCYVTSVVITFLFVPIHIRCSKISTVFLQLYIVTFVQYSTVFSTELISYLNYPFGGLYYMFWGLRVRMQCLLNELRISRPKKFCIVDIGLIRFILLFSYVRSIILDEKLLS